MEHTTRMTARTTSLDDRVAVWAAFCHDCGWELEGDDKDEVMGAAMRHEYQTYQRDAGSASVVLLAVPGLVLVALVVAFMAQVLGAMAS